VRARPGRLFLQRVYAFDDEKMQNATIVKSITVLMKAP
jgi:hypothetical protein